MVAELNNSPPTAYPYISTNAMVRGNFANGDVFVDCPDISQFLLRAVFGVWINVCIAVVAFCVLSVFRSQVKHQLLSDDPHKQVVSLWRVSPAVTAFEVFELRGVLIRSLLGGHFFYALASVFCVISAVISAASTIISNHVIVTNSIMRQSVATARLVTNEHTVLSGAVVNVTSQVNILNRANAPLNELFDFVPNENVAWVYEVSQWNNTWRGECSYAKHLAVDLVVYPSKNATYQTEVPLLGNYIPHWATLDPSKQGTDYSGFYSGAAANGTGKWADLIVTYAFGSAPAISINSFASTVNISLVNFLAHNVARDPNTTFLQTSLRSDIHVVDCTFNNAAPGIRYQAYAGVGQYLNAAGNVANIYKRSVTEASINQKEVVQPTGQEMLRYWQAFMCVKDAQYLQPVERTLYVSQNIVQIRLSAIVITIGAFLVAVTAAATSRFTVSRKFRGRRVHLPNSQLDWIVQAAREHRRGSDDSAGDGSLSRSPAAFSVQHADLSFAVTTTPEEQRNTWIVTTTAKKPHILSSDLPYAFDPSSLYEASNKSPRTPDFFPGTGDQL